MLYVLRNGNNDMRRNILKHAEPNVIKALAEIAHNILNGNVPLNANVKKRLAVYKKELRALGCSKRKLSSKRKLLIQRGGAFIAPLIGSILSGLIGAYLNR